VLHPPPFFARLCGGREPRDCPDSPGWCGTGLRGHPGASTRRRRGQIGGQHRRPRAGEEPRRCLHRSTQRRRWPRNLRLFVRPLPSFLFLFPPAFFCFSLSLPGEGRCSRGPSCGIRHRPEKWQSHPAPCGAAEERRADAGSVRFGSSAPGGRPPLPHGPVMSVEEGEGA
jgi:hypothetical protein